MPEHERSQLVRSLVATRIEESDRREVRGLNFAERGSADAVNLGGPDSPSFVIGPAAIARAVSGGATGPPSPVSWSADRALVASSGDLGITFGFIRPNASSAPGAQGARFPFFTIWHRPGPTDVWRYIAE